MMGGPAVDAASKVPLYHQIYIVLRHKILSGECRMGELLPSEQEIARLYKVSRITAKRAMDELAQAGLVVRERGRGTTVSYRPPSPPVRSTLEGWLENVSQMGLNTRAEVLEFAYVPASEEIARALGVDPGTQVQRAVRVRSMDGQSLSYLETWVPEDVGRCFDRTLLGQQPLLMLLERSGIVVASARQIITATVADTAVAAALGIDLGTPLLEVRRTVYDREERAVEHIRVLYRTDRYQYEMLLSRERGESANRWRSAFPRDEQPPL